MDFSKLPIHLNLAQNPPTTAIIESEQHEDTTIPDG